jgi:hypothetical protein
MGAQLYTGGCHCGAVRYEVTADLDHTMTCNCSRCAKLGVVLAFAPATTFYLKSGKDSLTEYRFNKKVIAHQFCKVCGVQSFSRGMGPDGTEMAAINVRCLDEVDLSLLESTQYDGRAA